MRPTAATFIAFLMLFAGVQTAPAEVFVLTGGGRVVGELLNRDESPRKRYVVQVAEGAKVTLDAVQVQQVIRQRPDEAEYEQIRPTYPDTAAAQWELAEWCREHKLTKQRDVHLQRVIELDPNHAKARRALGYSQVEGKWATRDEVMIQRGYHKYKGQWKLQQEIDILEGKRKQDTAQQEWFQKIKRWRGWLDTDRQQQAVENIHAIDDPVAVKALAAALDTDPVPAAKLLYIEALAKLDTPDAAKALAVASISDPVEEVRFSCLDRLKTKKRPDIVAFYVGKLSSKKSDNPTINRAAYCLGQMKDPSAIGPLIDALITVHKFKIVKPGGDNAMSGTFGKGAGGSGGTGLSAGNKPTMIRQSFSNQTVLDALVALTGQNFNFDKQAWTYWFAAQKKPAETIDARRD